MLRLTTFHSARGVDGTDCLVFGLDDLHDEDAVWSLLEQQQQLAYIAISRAKSRTIICSNYQRPKNLKAETPSYTEFLQSLTH